MAQETIDVIMHDVPSPSVNVFPHSDMDRPISAWFARVWLLVELDSLPQLQKVERVTLYGRAIKQDLFLRPRRLYETEALVMQEPCDLSRCHVLVSNLLTPTPRSMAP